MEHFSPEKLTKSSTLPVQSGVKLNDGTAERNSGECSAVPLAVEQKSRRASDENDLNAINIELTHLPPLSQSNTETFEQSSGLNTVDMEQKSKEHRTKEHRAAELNTVGVGEKSTDLVRTNHVAVIRPCVRSSATPKTQASQSELISPPAAVCSSTPFKLGTDEKFG